MTRADRVVFLTLTLLSAAALLLSNVIFAGGEGELVVVEVNGREYGSYELNTGNERKTLELRTEFGYNKIEWENGRVKITEADCPDGLCVHSGWLSKAGHMAVCLPNRVVVRVEGRGEVDGVAY